jgi:tetratricopeptide (TPR) repeat protein
VSHDLVELEQEALKAQNAGRLRDAIARYEELVGREPKLGAWHGHYSLACCYEDVGDLASAEQSYRKALTYEPQNPTFLGGLASFLYLHGDPAESFRYHLALLRFELAHGCDLRAKQIVEVLTTLGKKMGLSDNAIAERLRSER